MLKSISVVSGDGISSGIKNTYGMISDIFSSVRQLSGIAALCLAMVGVRTVLKKIGEQKLGSDCRKYSFILLITGIMFTLNDIAGLILTVFMPHTAAALTEENLPIGVIYAILIIITVIISIPAFLTIRKSCENIYGMLLRAQEV